MMSPPRVSLVVETNPWDQSESQAGTSTTLLRKMKKILILKKSLVMLMLSNTRIARPPTKRKLVKMKWIGNLMILMTSIDILANLPVKNLSR